jgi:hypothetical protein
MRQGARWRGPDRGLAAVRPGVQSVAARSESSLTLHKGQLPHSQDDRLRTVRAKLTSSDLAPRTGAMLQRHASSTTSKPH